MHEVSCILREGVADWKSPEPDIGVAGKRQKLDGNWTKQAWRLEYG
jgi:hypothetical protein